MGGSCFCRRGAKGFSVDFLGCWCTPWYMNTALFKSVGLGLLIVFQVATSGAETGSAMRTWTSVSGATVEAQYVGMERGELVLRGSDGREFVIRPDQLSEADQQYVREQLDIVAEEQPVAADEPDAKPGELHTDDIPGLTLQDPRFAASWGVQYGPQSDEVVYFIFDRSSDAEATTPRDRLYRYQPGRPNPLEKVDGRSETHDRDRYTEFEVGTFSAQYDGVPGRHTIRFSSGPGRFDLIYAHIESAYGRGRDETVLEMAGVLNNIYQLGPGVIPVHALHQGFRISLRNPSHGEVPRFDGDIVAHRDLYVQGAREVMASVEAEAFTADGRSVERPRLPTRNARTFPSSANRPSMLQVAFDRLTPGETYKLQVTADLGPVIGPVKWEQEHRMR